MAAEPQNWHTLDAADVIQHLESRAEGLSAAEAARRLETYGRNELPQQPPPTWWMILLRQFNSPLIYVLAAAAIVSLAIGDFKDAGIIFVVLAINALIGAYQEWRAEQDSQALQKLLRIRAAVVRDGEVVEIDAEEVVPGDVVWLESGNRVPADMRLAYAHGLEVDESFLTGESLSVQKDAHWIGAEGTTIGDRKNMAFAGAIVARGRARGVVVGTGMETAVGQLATDVLGTAGGKPPLVERMERFSQAVAVLALVACVIVGIIGVTVQGQSVHEMFFFSVALAVSAIPEGLPAAMTVALSIATTRMARRGVIVRRLTAVEGLGSCTLVASDKTGTLTCNELTVREARLPDGRIFSVSGEGFIPEGQVTAVAGDSETAPLEPLALATVLCNEGELHHRNSGWVWHGDPTDVALLAFAHKLGFGREALLSQFEQINEIPFEAEHRFSATFHQFENGPRVFVKGAPERVLSMCSVDGVGAQREQLEELATDMARQGYRVLALAEGDAPADLDASQTPPAPENLRLLGLVGMIDPLRPGVRDAVEQCQRAGVGVAMITGDHPITAKAIARDLGLVGDDDRVVTGAELAEMSPEEMTALIDDVHVFARVEPRQKLQLVEAARAAGHYVAVTGDGVNDAPALRTANIGVAMGRSGTDVAREASELVISDDNFATIVAGIEEGRVAYDNVRKVIYLLVSTGAAEVVAVTLALSWGLPLPFLPVQLLWLNLVTNGIQGIALAFEPNEGDVLRRLPRSPREPIFNRLMIERTIIGAGVIGVGSFLAFWWLLPENYTDGELASARNILLLLMVLFENVHIGNSRSETKSGIWLPPFKSPILLAGTLCAFGLHVLMMYVPAGRTLLGVEPVVLSQFVVLFLLATTVFWAGELHKLTWAWRYPKPAKANA